MNPEKLLYAAANVARRRPPQRLQLCGERQLRFAQYHETSHEKSRGQAYTGITHPIFRLFHGSAHGGITHTKIFTHLGERIVPTPIHLDRLWSRV
ncbi:hypothetical protein [Candidatus Nitrotoga sp. M5]|uniref:hypothetical protein n=1 Tax=Candidatus Nitrotoga sp. M5 TaxID=2890409 RepID=UPI001EF322E1|nr:hypothetical protein [Candidatus Nitrotoga sp. M5]